MQLAKNESGYYTLQDNDCGLCGEDLPGTASTVKVAAEIDGAIQVSDCAVYTDEQGTVRVANPDELVRCFA